MFRQELSRATPPANAARLSVSLVRVHHRAVPTVRRCLPAERDAALATVVAAFAVDPLLRWVWPDDARYAVGAPPFFGLLLDLRLEAGEVWLADGGASVAMWDPPGGLYLPTPDERWAGVQEQFTAAEREAWATFDAAVGVPAAAGPHWYLGVLATAPDRQGRGLGRAATAPMLAAADRTGLPAYLETASSRNVPIYRSWGFEVARDVDLPGDGPHCWLMHRPPQAPR